MNKILSSRLSLLRFLGTAGLLHLGVTYLSQVRVGSRLEVKRPDDDDDHQRLPAQQQHRRKDRTDHSRDREAPLDKKQGEQSGHGLRADRPAQRVELLI